MGPIYKFVMAMLAKRGGKTGLTTIQRGSGLNVELSVKQIEQTLKNMGVDVSKIKTPKEVEKFLNMNKSFMDQQIKQKAKTLGLTDPEKNIFMKGPSDDKLKKGIKKSLKDVEMIEVPKMSIEELTEGLIKDDPFKGWRPKVIEGG